MYEIENEKVLARIKVIHEESKQRYGAPKIHYLLTKEGFTVSLKRVQRIMRKANIRSITTKKYRPASPLEQVKEQVNIIKQDFRTTTINEKWVADITYIYTQKDNWCYLASVLDLHTRKVVGYSFSTTMTTELVIKALENAVEVQCPTEGLILHTDLGSQYTSDVFQQVLEDKGIKQSFSRKGCPYDNACIESFHSILKKEEVYTSTYSDFEEARIALFYYIESWYNRKRIHSSINYLTPQQLEDIQRQKIS